MENYVRVENPLEFESLDDFAEAIRGEFPRHYDDTQEVYDGVQSWVKRMKDEGYDGVKFSDEEFGGTSIVPFEPNQIRSVKAAFDPAKKDLPNLMASVAPTALGIGYSALTPNQAQASQSRDIGNGKNIGAVVGEYVEKKPIIDKNPLGLPQSNEYDIANSYSANGLLSPFAKAYDSGITGIARGPVNSAGKYANYADKYNQWRKTLGPIDMLLPVGELPQSLLDKIAYGESVTMSDKIKAMFGLL